jgi:DNA polymerase I
MIVTYFGDKFDFPYSIGRFDLYNIPHSFSFKKMKTEGGKKTLRAVIGGSRAVGEKYVLKVHMDLCQYLIRKYIKQYAYKNSYPNVKLNTVSEVLLGEKKLDHEGRSVAELPIPELILYNAQDTKLTTKIMKREGKEKKNEKKKKREGEILPTVILLMRIGLQSFDDCHRTEVSPKIANLFFSLLHNRNWLIPQKLELKKVGKFATKATIKGKKYQGAFVVKPTFGVHFRISLLDFASLYPTIIKEKNISFETVNCPHEECKSNLVPGTANEETGYAGHWICTKEKGLLAQFLGFIRDIRVNYYKRLGKTDPIAGVIEQVLKVFMNATYGVFAAIFFSLFVPALAECVAAYSRHSFMRLYKYATEDLELEVVLGDTDSIYVKDLTEEKMELLFKFALEELDLELELEDTFRLVLASERKKNYWCVDEKGKEKIKGLMIKKSNTPKIFKDCSQEIRNVLIHELLSIEDLNTVKKKVKKIIINYMTRIWLKQGEIGDYAFWMRIKKPLSKYVKTTPQHVKAAKKEARYIISDMPKGSGLTAEQIIEPGWIQGFIKGLDTLGKETVIPLVMATKEQINPEKYHEALITVIDQLVEPLGIDTASLIPDDPRQKNLMSYFG